MSKLNLDQFESIFIYKCLSDAQYLSLVSSIVKDEYFSCKHRRIIFNKVKNFYDKRSTLPNLVELKSQLPTEEELNSLKKVIGEVKEYNALSFNEKELIENTERFLKERALHETLMSVATDIKDDKTLDTSSILDKFEKNCNISLHTNIGLDLFQDVNKVVDDLTKSDPVIPSGWNWLDEKLGGGFRSEGKAVYIFAGQTNVGKSIFLGNLAVNIANTGRTVVLISLEMSEMIYARRLGAKLTAIPMKQLSEKCDDFSYKMKSYASSNPNSRILIKEFPPSTITPRGLDAFLKSLLNKGIEIDAIVLDYINLLTTPEGNNSYEKIKYITEQVRSLTYLFNCPIITATQLTRAGFDTQDPDLTTISESIGLAATADFIASVFQQEGDNMNNRIRVGLMKNRWGTNSGTNVFGIDYSTLSIYEDESLNDEENEEVEEASRALNDGD